jgi:hypothetical protein
VEKKRLNGIINSKQMFLSKHNKNFLNITFLWVLALGLVFFLRPPHALSQEVVFYRNLSVGAVGDDVRNLQKELNKNVSTRLVDNGPGSPGNETVYFGPLTKDAVVRYQELYSEEVLIPIGLHSGTGFVGSMTRGKLNKNAQVAENNVEPYKQEVDNEGSGVESATKIEQQITQEPLLRGVNGGPPTTLSQQLAVDARNKENVELFIQKVRETNGSRFEGETMVVDGVEMNAIDAIEKQIRLDVATTTEHADRYYGGNDSVLLKPITSLLSGFNITDTNNTASGEKIAQAAGGTLYPFGGAVVFTLLCTCSGTWQILVAPAKPAYLDYTYAQGYANYNLPYARNTLGLFVPGTSVCQMYIGTGCTPIYSEGTITFITGSSL